MNGENGPALIQVRQFDVDLAVETASPQKCPVKYIGPVGGGHDDHTRVGAESVHFGE